MKAFLETLGGEYLDDFVYCSVLPLKDLGYTIVKFDGANLENTLLNKHVTFSDIIIGSVEATAAFFKMLNIEEPQYLGYPKELEQYLGRTISKITLEECKQWDCPFFIKPADKVKLFTGSIIEKESTINFLKEFCKTPGDSLVYLSDLVKIKSEYRVFVHKGEIKGIQFYLGDFKTFPNIETIEEMVKTYTSSPIAYTLDVGVTEENQTILIEVNDFWAIGSYGFDAKIYVKMIITRFQQIISQYVSSKKKTI